MRRKGRSLISDLILTIILILISSTLITLDIKDIFTPRTYLYDLKNPILSTKEAINKIKENNHNKSLEELYNLRDIERVYQEKKTTQITEELQGLYRAEFTLPHQIVEARVIERIDHLDKIKELRLNKGKNDKIKNGMVVICSDGLIGTIEKVFRNSAIVKIINSPEIKISVVIPQTDEKGIMKFDNQKKGLYIDYIPRNSNAKIGDLVFTSGDGGKFPEGILIGRIDDTIFDKGSIYKRCYLSMSVKLEKVEYTGIIFK